MRHPNDINANHLLRCNEYTIVAFLNKKLIVQWKKIKTLLMTMIIIIKKHVKGQKTLQTYTLFLLFSKVKYKFLMFTKKGKKTLDQEL